MRSPRDMDIIEIELTNGCIHKCSNCTRFCGHHKVPFYMDFETFQRAVDSMDGFHGTLSLMGGEPTLHPEFSSYARYLNDHLPEEKRKKENPLLYPQKDLMRAVGIQNIRNMENFPTSTGGHKTCVDGAGTFSAMGPSFMKHYEAIQDYLKFEGLNDHSNTMYHQPILISRRELGIDDETWHKLRDNCWINNQWSASITPKGAFFCEIAGALDMLFDGPGGLPIEPGWWDHDISYYEEQMTWCEMCGLALQTFSRDANEELDDVSPLLAEQLQAIGSRRKQKGKINVVDIVDGQITEESKKAASDYRGDFYSSSYSSRFTAASSAVYPKGFEIYRLEEAGTTREGDKIVDRNYGQVVYDALMESKEGSYIVILSGDRSFEEESQNIWKQYVINPGTLHYSTDERGSVALLSKYASSLKLMGADKLLACQKVEDLADLWIQEKAIDFDDALNHEVAAIKVDKSVRYVTYGAGNNGEVLLRELLTAGADVAAVIDSDENKWEADFCGCKIQPPQWLLDQVDSYDRVVIASTDYYDEIRQKLIEMGIDERSIYKNETFWK